MAGERFPYQLHISLNLYGATKNDLQRAMNEAYEQLSQGIPESCTELSGHTAGFNYKTSSDLPANGADPGPKPPSKP